MHTIDDIHTMDQSPTWQDHTTEMDTSSTNSKLKNHMTYKKQHVKIKIKTQAYMKLMIWCQNSILKNHMTLFNKTIISCDIGLANKNLRFL
jgi:hypothetical protein